LCVVCKTVIFHKSLGLLSDGRTARGGEKGREKRNVGIKGKGGNVGVLFRDRRAGVGACLCIITWFNCHGGKQINEFRSENFTNSSSSSSSRSFWYTIDGYCFPYSHSLSLPPIHLPLPLALVFSLSPTNAICGHRSLHMHQNSIRIHFDDALFGSKSFMKQKC